MGKYPDYHEEGFQRFLRKLYLNLEFDRWYFGHWHQDRVLNDRFTAICSKVHTVQTDDGKE